MEKVNTEIAALQTSCACDYMEDLLTAVFIAHTKVLTAIRVSAKQKKVQITVPKVEHFMFKVLCETSKVLWGNSFLFRDGIPSMEKQQNYRTVEGLLAEGIHQAIRAMVPVKNILKDFVSSDDGEEEEEKANKEQNEEIKMELPEPKEEALPEQKEEPKEEQREEQKEEAKVEEQKEEAKEEAKEEQKEELKEIPIPLVDFDLSGNKNEVVEEKAEPVIAEQPIIRINTGNGPRVGFTQLDTMFDTEFDGNDIIEESGEEDVGGLEILDGEPEPLDFGDMDILAGNDPLDAKDEPIESGDYDVLV